MKSGRKVQGIVYHQNGAAVHILCLHRTALEGGFWQPLTGTVEEGESYEKCLVRELEEETGILNEQIMYTTGPLKTFRWNREGIEYEEHVYAVQVSPETQVSLSTEHDEYRWLIPERAKELFKFSEVQDGVDILHRKAATQHQVVAKVTRALASELGWTLNPASLRSIFAGFANHVFSFEYENEKYYVKYFPEVFKEKESVAKPAGSFERESLVYELANTNNSMSTPELIHQSKTEPLLVTKAWGLALNPDMLDSMTIPELADQICLIVKHAASFRSVLSSESMKSALTEFSKQQAQYLILNPLQNLHLPDEVAKSFIEEYSTLDTGVILGDLSLKNILIDGSQVRFCDFESVFVAPQLFDTCYLIADLVSKLDQSKCSPLLNELYDSFKSGLTHKERSVFFPLTAVCMSYRNANSLSTRTDKNLELGFLHSVFNTKPL